MLNRLTNVKVYFHREGPFGIDGPFLREGPFGIDGPFLREGPIGIDGPFLREGPFGIDGPFLREGPFRRWWLWCFMPLSTIRTLQRKIISYYFVIKFYLFLEEW
jgi:hypothetical protein